MSILNKTLCRKAVILFVVSAFLVAFAGCAGKEKPVDSDITKPLDPKMIKAISVSEGDGTFNVDIEGNRLLTYTSVKKPVPLSVILYFPETELSAVQKELAVENDVVASITATEMNANGKASRVEILMKKDVAYEVVRRDNGLDIVFLYSVRFGVAFWIRQRQMLQKYHQPVLQP